MKEEDKNTLIQKRGRVKGTLTRLKTFADNITSVNALEEITVRLQKLEESWKEFCSIEDCLLLIDPEVSEIEEMEHKYFDIKSLLLRAQSDREHAHQQHATPNNDLNSTMNQLLLTQQSMFQGLDRSQNNSQYARLPKLNIPSFAGDYKEWPSFKDLFDSSINSNDSLTGSQKFQYLKGLLKDTPAALIRHLSVADATYTEAWNKLKERFDKPSHIATSFIKTFLDQSTVATVTAKSLRNLTDTLDEVIRGLRPLGVNAEKRDPWLIHIALSKLDLETRELWSQETSEKNFPSFEEFLKFLNKRCDILEAIMVSGKKSSQTVKTLHSSVSTKQETCPKCTRNHLIYQCPEFKATTLQDRKSFVVSQSLCFRCLGCNHSVKNCWSKIRCQQCKGNHHSLLHSSSFKLCQKPTSINSTVVNDSSGNFISSRNIDTPINNFAINPISSINSNSPINVENISTPPVCNLKGNLASFKESLTASVSPPQDSKLASFTTYADKLSSNCNNTSAIALLPTAVCYVRDAKGNYQNCRLLLDSGSQISLISQSCADRLGLRKGGARLSLSGLSSTNVGITKGKIHLNLFPRCQNSRLIEVMAFIISNLSSYIPSTPIETIEYVNIKELNLADPSFHQPSPIDILLGADKFFEVLRAEKLYNDMGVLIAQETVFGWIITGALARESLVHSMNTTVFTNLDKTLQRFWTIEELPTSTFTISEEEALAEAQFKATFCREESGRYVVSIPFKKNKQHLGNSLQNAIARLRSVERRFSRDSDYKQAYISFMREYEQLGHMEHVPTKEMSREADKYFYLPHHAVFKKGPNTKMRVVFDGSCKTSSGISLNQTLMVGPTIQRDLTSILISFRKHRVALSADVEKMYRQVLVDQESRYYQRILWREDPSKPICHFSLNTVTYGTSSAPFLATRVLHQIGEEAKKTSSDVATIIQNDFYVDDLLSGADTIESAILLQRQLTEILSASGFPLVKWRSNMSSDTTNIDSLPIDDDSGIAKVLGIQWAPADDVFLFNISTDFPKADTKRKILSEASRIFDPMGWLSPITINLKILFQKLWLLKRDWDEVLPNDITRTWERLSENLSTITQIRIPRQIYSSIHLMELHGFADASELAYAAVIYSRSKNEEGKFIIRLAAAKTRVAPLKQISIPRLELCAALLLARLFRKVIQSLTLNEVKLYAWTDSSVVLAWLSDVPRRWKSYIANRTSEILEMLPNTCWRHVPSRDNPADCASRGIMPAELVEHILWWQGPHWLTLQQDKWPCKPSSVSATEVRKEERKVGIFSHFQELSNVTLTELSSKYSSYRKLVRVLAYCLRFISNTRKLLSDRDLFFLSTNEINRAKTICTKWIQETAYSREVNELKANRLIPRRSTLNKLCPFLDKEEILRVGGRLQNSDYCFDAQHPIILPKDHPITKLIILDLHRTYLHPGPSSLISITRQRYWIPSVRNMVRWICRDCLTCFRRQASRPPTQLMGNLPRPRVTMSRPFSQVGVDYAGPLTLSTRTGRGSRTMKGYIALFVCFATKALHLEAVTSLSSEAFIAALQRFVSRRGVPKDIYSDNGTNFVGAKRHLNDLNKVVISVDKDPLISSFISEQNIVWHFIPPGAPNFGGLWEAGVRSVKGHLRRVVGETLLGFEELTTMLTQIEAVLNSRPLCASSSDPDDFNALTPAHFLIGQALTSLPQREHSEQPISQLRRWQLIQAMVQGFWKRWRLDYLSTLQERQKWTTKNASLKQGDLVILREDNIPPTKWHLGRIIHTHPGKDNLVRVVSVKTMYGIFKRAINRVCKLPVG